MLSDFRKCIIRRFGKPKVIVAPELSGALVGVNLCREFDSNLCVVRKRRVKRHSSHIIEGNIPDVGDSWLIVDDLCSSGETISRVIKEIVNYREKHPDAFDPADYLGIYYSNRKYYTDKFSKETDKYYVNTKAKKFIHFRAKEVTK